MIMILWKGGKVEASRRLVRRYVGAARGELDTQTAQRRGPACLTRWLARRVRGGGARLRFP